jgi:ligand-binding sensor domain-containing protein
MKKEKTPFHEIKLFTGIALCFIMTSCNGQANNGDKQNVIKEEKTIQFPIYNKQISDVVRTIFQDSKDNIWFGTQNGAFKLTGDSLIHIDNIKSEFGKGVTIKDIAEDKNGIIWLGHGSGISSIDGKLVTNYYESDGLISNDVWCIETDVNGNVWIGTIEGACIFDGQEFTKFDLPEGKKDTTLAISSTKMVHSILEDSKGTFWLSTNAALFSYANNKLTNISDKVGIQTNFVNEIFEDRSGVIWVSTKMGLYKLKENKAINITEGKIETGKGIGSIAEDENGKIWFVSNQHYLYTYDGKDFLKIQKSEENKGPVVFQIYKDRQSRLWFVGYGGAYRYENDRFINVTQNGPW